MNPRQTNVDKVYDDVTVTASTYEDSPVIDLRGVPAGNFGLQWRVTGDGTAKIEFLPSINGADFIDVNADIASGQTKTSGPAADGKNLASFSSEVCTCGKFRVTETGTSDDIVINAWFKAY